MTASDANSAHPAEICARPSYTTIRDFLDGYTNDLGEIQGDPATIAAEFVGFGLATADEQYAIQLA